MEFSVKNADLAPGGRHRIEWAEQEMPGPTRAAGHKHHHQHDNHEQEGRRHHRTADLLYP